MLKMNVDNVEHFHIGRSIYMICFLSAGVIITSLYRHFQIELNLICSWPVILSELLYITHVYSGWNINVRMCITFMKEKKNHFIPIY